MNLSRSATFAGSIPLSSPSGVRESPMEVRELMPGRATTASMPSPRRRVTLLADSRTRMPSDWSQLTQDPSLGFPDGLSATPQQRPQGARAAWITRTIICSPDSLLAASREKSGGLESSIARGKQAFMRTSQRRATREIGWQSTRKRPRRVPGACAETLTHRTTSIRLLPSALGRIILASSTKLCGNVVDSARSIDRVRASS